MGKLTNFRLGHGFNSYCGWLRNPAQVGKWFISLQSHDLRCCRVTQGRHRCRILPPSTWELTRELWELLRLSGETSSSWASSRWQGQMSWFHRGVMERSGISMGISWVYGYLMRFHRMSMGNQPTIWYQLVAHQTALSKWWLGRPGGRAIFILVTWNLFVCIHIYIYIWHINMYLGVS